MSEDSRHWIQGPHDARCDLRYEVSMEVNPYSLHKQSNFRFDTGNLPAALNQGSTFNYHYSNRTSSPRSPFPDSSRERVRKQIICCRYGFAAGCYDLFRTGGATIRFDRSE